MRCGMMKTSVFLAAAVALSLAAVGAEAGDGLVVRNRSIVEKVFPDKYAPTGTLGPVHLTGVKNGVFAGQLVVSRSGGAIVGLKVVATDLQGAGTIPASAIQIRYALPDGASPGRKRPRAFDSLGESAPKEVKFAAGSLAVQPIWLTVSVPANAKAGKYAGKVTISAEGVASVEVELQLRVIDWSLPDADKFSPHMDLVQSPESLAMAYDVELWSDAHFKLLDKTFSLMRPLAAKTLYITAVRRTHFGNEHAMIWWYRNEKRELVPSFHNVERYLDVAIKHLGKVPIVVLYAWEPVNSEGHAGNSGVGRQSNRSILYTYWRKKSGKLSKRNGPDWGTPEAKIFWKKCNDGLRAVLKKRGIEDSLVFGLIGDARPTKQGMDDISSGVKNAKWAVHSHHYCKEWHGYDVSMCSALWGIHLNIVDPSKGRGYGWRNSWRLLYYPREFSMNSTLIELRYKLEMWLGAFSVFEMKHKGKTRTARGLGRIGVDFWPVLKDRRGRARYYLPGRYPESYWGQLNLTYCLPYILGMGKGGPLATVRSEAFREGIQDAEARVFIEKAIVPDETRALVGEKLAARARTLLDERIRMVNVAGKPRKDQSTAGAKRSALPADWPQRRVALYELAAEIAKKLGK